MSDHGDTIVELRNVHKRFGSLVVLRGVNLSLQRGKTTVIIGESGTGKSVLLKNIMGLIRPDLGEVYFQGQRVDRLKPKEWVQVRKQFGFLFQMGALFDSLTAIQNVGFPLTEHTQYSDVEIERIATEKLAMVGLAGVGQKRPAELSGGQRKRVALARAIALDPKVILYDEPTTGLDPLRSDSINDLIIKLQQELNVTSVVVTHDLVSAFKVGDRVLMLHQGQFIADGTPDEFRHSSDPRVRRFVAGDADMDENGAPPEPAAAGPAEAAGSK